MDVDLSHIEFETLSARKRFMKRALVNPLANYMPAWLTRAVLRRARSELAQANWDDPGGWRSMVISYEANPTQHADKVLIKAGTIPMALRNRRKLAGHIFAQLIDAADPPVEVLCLGAGPGIVIMDALAEVRNAAHATLVDLSSDAFDFGRERAESLGLSDKVRFIESDVREVGQFLDRKPALLTMLGLCEYLDDEHILDIANAAAEVMPAGSRVVTNSLSNGHGTDRFFRRVFGLHMNHRSPARLAELLGGCGFGEFEQVPEPLGVYHVLVGRRK